MINQDYKNPDKLNEDCGAEFVHKEQKFPLEYQSEKHKGFKCASFDGDADRLIYFYESQQGKLEIMDGDKQFVLIVLYIKSLLQALDISDSDLSHMLIQTAYCNARGTAFLEEKKINNTLCPTGVKHAHPIAHKYDIGANDEPNGHGTVVAKWDKVMAALKGKEDRIEAKKLVAILKLSNMTVGDAIANLLLIESILRDWDMSIEDFNNLYYQNPSKSYKTVVKDRTKFKVIWDESRLTQPLELQDIIDDLVKQVDEGKAFVRPSGTEDILRIYSEAKTEDQMDWLAQQIIKAIHEKFKDF